MRRARRLAVAAIVGGLAIAGIGLAAPGSAERLQQDRIVSPNPADFTPNIQNGTAYAVTQIGNRIYVGGSFTQVKAVGAATAITRNYILAFNASTGAIDNSFYPQLNGAVYDLLPASDGQSIYVAGQFSQLGGVAHKGLVRLNASTGALISSFRPPSPNGIVRNVELANGKLYIGGTWFTLGGVSRPSLAALDPSTGALDSSINFQFSGIHNGGTTLVYSFDIAPDGSRLVAIGNFDQVNGVKRHQFAVFDLTTNPATLANYYTTRFEPTCATSIQQYMRDVQFSLDSSYFAIATTGAGFSGTLCDSLTRWETAKSGSSVPQTWVDYTGGDTLTQIAVTGPVLYVGGHQRWLNNTGCADTTCQGAVSREGIAAISPENGLPFSWNPGKDRGHAVEDLVPTLDGLWVASDTAGIGGEWHSKIAKFPLSGGKVVPSWVTGSLPGNVYMGGQISPSQNSLKHRAFDGTTAGGVVTDGTAGLDWTLVRGAFMINGRLYYGLSTDGSFNRRSYNGVSLGSPTPINAADQLKFMTTWHNQVKVLQGLFYANGRLYYTRGDSALHYRYFNPESDIVGPDEFTAAGNLPGVSWSSVGGMFVDNGQLYFVNNSSGSLNRIAFAGGVPTGSASVVNSGDWRARGVFLFQGPPNQPPVASFSSSCQELACAFNGTASSDPDGTITSYAWDFGDGATATGAQPMHTFAAAGTYPVKLTVTDNLGGTGSITHSVQVARNGIDFRATSGFNANSNTPAVTVPAGVQPGDGMLLMLTINSSTVTISSNPAGWQTVGTATSSGITSRVWKRVAAGDAGTSVTVGLSDFAKADLRLVAYHGTNGTDPVSAATSSIDAAATATHVSPVANVAQAGSWVLSYWADKGTTTAWTAPGGVVTRASSFGTSTAHISALTADSGGAAGAGTYGGLSAVADVAANKAVSWTIVLAP